MAADMIPTEEGNIPFKAPGIDDLCHTHYKVFGDLHSGHVPLVILHGGPGAGHEYLLPYAKLASTYNIPVVMYDQIGCAGSTHLQHKAGDDTFWTADLFIAELNNLTNHLGLDKDDKPGFDVLGHSFGGMFGVFYAAQRPAGLRRLILAGAASNTAIFREEYGELKKTLSQPSQKAIDEAVRTGDFKNPEYMQAFGEFARTYTCRATPWPNEYLAMNLKNQAEDSTVRSSVVGPCPWIAAGSFKDFDSIPILPKINVPTLVYNGEFDTAQRNSTAPFFNLIPKVRWVTIAGSSHMHHLDTPEQEKKVLNLVAQFLRPEESISA